MLSVGEIAVIHAANRSTTRYMISEVAAEMVGDKAQFDPSRAGAALDRLITAGYLRKADHGYERTRKGQEALETSVVGIRALLSQIQ